MSCDSCFACFCVVRAFCFVLLFEDVRAVCVCMVECVVGNVCYLSLLVMCVLPVDL